MTVEESPTLSKYGRLRERYLREHKRLMYYTLLTSGKLYEHLAEIDTSARDMAEYLIKEMARKQGVTEELKARDMLRWVGKMNNIRACADEIVLNDIVYSLTEYQPKENCCQSMAVFLFRQVFKKSLSREYSRSGRKIRKDVV